jgi:hypothetical protein
VTEDPSNVHVLKVSSNSERTTKTAKAQKPRPFLSSGSDGLRFIHSITTASLIYLPTLSIDSITNNYIDASAPMRSRKKLTLDEQEDIRQLSSTSTLRHLAKSYGVSHETIRKVIRSKPFDVMAVD